MKSQVQALNRNFYDDFGRRILFLRHKQGLTLAALSGGSPSTANSWERGSLPRPDQWDSIAGRLGLSVSFVFLGQPKSRADYDFIARFADEIGPPPPHPVEKKPEPKPSEAPTRRMMLNESFQPPAPALTRKQLEEQLRRILDEAEITPGGLGYINGLVNQYIDVEVLRRMRESAT